ncbi:serine/threonine-protein phosphatase, partial [Streptomyces sp. NPDC060198]
MSQIHQQTASLPTCPGCAEPLEPADLFCGACGYDLSAVPQRPGDRPTMAITTPPPASAPPVPAVAPAPPAVPPATQWPAASETDTSDRPAPVHRPADLPGVDSAGHQLPARASAPAAPAAPPAPQTVPAPAAPAAPPATPPGAGAPPRGAGRPGG